MTLRRVLHCKLPFVAASLIMASSVHAAEPVTSPVREAGFVGFLQQQGLDYQPFERWTGLRVKSLSEDRATGRLAVYTEFPAGWQGQSLTAVPQSVDLVLLDGELRFGESTLQPLDFAYLPLGIMPPELASPRLAHALLFFDPPALDAAAVQRQRERGAYVTHFDEQHWQPAALAKRAGADVDLRIFNLKNDPITTARTWYVKLSGGMRLPWEVHSMVEEGYLMRGDYTLAECLPQRSVIGDYSAGGYFWRPGGIAHGGPQSGTKGGVIWLQRSQVALDVVFYEECRDGVPLAPLTR